MIELCPPAIIYLIFSAIQILIDAFKGLYNTALIKIIVATMVTLLLNILCQQGLNVVSWIIVFIPFILMTVVVSMILYVFGLNAATGKLNYACNDYNKCPQNVKVYLSGNIIIYDPTYNPLKQPVVFKSPNLIVPNPNPNSNPNINSNITTILIPPSSSSSPIYQS
jgi:hypothetical protein